jgi:hypothetical protein
MEAGVRTPAIDAGQDEICSARPVPAFEGLDDALVALLGGEAVWRQHLERSAQEPDRRVWAVRVLNDQADVATEVGDRLTGDEATGSGCRPAGCSMSLNPGGAFEDEGGDLVRRGAGGRRHDEPVAIEADFQRLAAAASDLVLDRRLAGADLPALGGSGVRFRTAAREQANPALAE